MKTIARTLVALSALLSSAELALATPMAKGSVGTAVTAPAPAPWAAVPPADPPLTSPALLGGSMPSHPRALAASQGGASKAGRIDMSWLGKGASSTCAPMAAPVVHPPHGSTALPPVPPLISVCVPLGPPTKAK